MISQEELVGRIAALEADALQRWIALGWIRPAATVEGTLFGEADVARTHLICDLVYDLALDETSIPVILSLLDQLHDARHVLRVMGDVIAELPGETRGMVLERLRYLLGRNQ